MSVVHLSESRQREHRERRMWYRKNNWGHHCSFVMFGLVFVASRNLVWPLSALALFWKPRQQVFYVFSGPELNVMGFSKTVVPLFSIGDHDNMYLC